MQVYQNKERQAPRSRAIGNQVQRRAGGGGVVGDPLGQLQQILGRESWGGLYHQNAEKGGTIQLSKWEDFKEWAKTNKGKLAVAGIALLGVAGFYFYMKDSGKDIKLGEITIDSIQKGIPCISKIPQETSPELWGKFKELLNRDLITQAIERVSGGSTFGRDTFYALQNDLDIWDFFPMFSPDILI